MRRFLLVLGLMVCGVLAAGTASALWSTSASGSGASVALSLPAGPTPSGSVSRADVTVSWTQVSFAGSPLGTISGGGYRVMRYADGSSTPIDPGAGCSGTQSGATATLSCTENAVPDGTWRYTVTPVLHNWRGAASTQSNTVTAVNDAVPPTSSVTFPIASATYNGTGWTAGCGTPGTDEICGTASDDPGGTGVQKVEVSIRLGSGNYWSGSAFDSAAEVWLLATGTTDWTYGFPSTNFLADGPYSVRRRSTDNASNVEIPPASSTFTIDKTAPAVTITTPANGSSTNDTTSDLAGGAGNETGDSASVTVTIYNGSGTGGTVAESISATRSGAGWSATASTLAAGTYTAQATQTDAAGNTGTSGANTFTVDTTAPALQALEMFDVDANGKIDRVVATFSETLASYSAGNAPWTLTAVPSGGSLSSVSASGAQATLTLAEGSGSQDTAVGLFTVALASDANGIRDAAGNLSSFGATAPTDKAGPVVVSITDTNGTTDGLMQVGDALSITFSEAIAAASVPATVTVTETDPAGSGNDTITISSVTAGTRDTGSNGYIAGNNRSAAYGSSIAVLASGNTVLTVTVAGICSGAGCGADLTAGGPGTLAFAPAATITDAASNAAAATFSKTSFRIF